MILPRPGGQGERLPVGFRPWSVYSSPKMSDIFYTCYTSPGKYFPPFLSVSCVQSPVLIGVRTPGRFHNAVLLGRVERAKQVLCNTTRFARTGLAGAVCMLLQTVPERHHVQNC